MADNGWSTMTIGQIAHLIHDVVDPTDYPGVPYIGLEHIGEGTLALLDYGRAEDVQSTKLAFRRDDILFGKLRPYFRKVILAPFDGICSTDIWVIRPANGIDQRFLFYVLASNWFVEAATQASEGTRMPRANWEFVSRLEISIPPLSEQRAIAHILGTLDDKIELNRRMNETLEAIARAIFKSWFVDFDPVIDNALKAGKPIPDELAEKAAHRSEVLERARAEGRPAGLPEHLARLFPDEFVESELGLVPKGWNLHNLDEIASYLNGLPLQNYPPKGNRSLPVIKIAQLRKGDTEGADRASIEIPTEYIVNDGDILFSWSGSLEVEIWCGECGALNQHLFKVTSKLFPKWFYYFWLKHYLPVFQSIAADKATTMGHIQRYHLTEAKAVVSPPELLKEADKIFTPLLDKVISNRIESHILALMRNTLLPKLISGELRIKDVEKSIC